MAYTPINWQTGDTITAEKMNKMDNGWEVDSIQLFNETVTAEDTGEGYSIAQLVYSEFINADTIVVTFNGVDYNCSNEGDGVNYSVYGAQWSDSLGGYDFSTYPFAIESSTFTNPITGSETSETYMYTATSGTYTLAVLVEAIEISDTFSTAVNAAVSSDRFQVKRGTTTWQEVYDALAAGKFVYYLEPNGTDTINLNVVIYAGLNARDDHIIRSVSYDGTSIIDTGMSTASADGVLS